MFNVKGSTVTLVTLFHEDGSANFNKLKEILEWHVENGTDGILVLGIAGESSTMTHEENDVVVECTPQTIRGRIPVTIDSGPNCTGTAADRSERHTAMGADALLMISSYYNRANVQGMIAHFTAVTDTVDKPIVPYNAPGRTRRNTSEGAVKALSKRPNICGIKEANGDIVHTAVIAWYLSDDFVAFSGNDDMVTPLLSLDGNDVISVRASIMPEEVHEMVYNYLGGNTGAVLATQLHYLDLVRALPIEVNLIPVKGTLNITGKAVGGYRLSLCEIEETHHKALLHEMRKVGLR